MRVGGRDGDLKSNFWQLFESKRAFYLKTFSFLFALFSIMLIQINGWCGRYVIHQMLLFSTFSD